MLGHSLGLLLYSIEMNRKNQRPPGRIPLRTWKEHRTNHPMKFHNAPHGRQVHSMQLEYRKREFVLNLLMSTEKQSHLCHFLGNLLKRRQRNLEETGSHLWMSVGDTEYGMIIMTR
jgi:hypothetical protein